MNDTPQAARAIQFPHTHILNTSFSDKAERFPASKQWADMLSPYMEQAIHAEAHAQAHGACANGDKSHAAQVLPPLPENVRFEVMRHLGELQSNALNAEAAGHAELATEVRDVLGTLSAMLDMALKVGKSEYRAAPARTRNGA